MAYMAGHEIATHTYHHVALANASEIVSARTWLNQARPWGVGLVSFLTGMLSLPPPPSRTIRQPSPPLLADGARPAA